MPKYHTYSFDKGNGERRRGYTARLSARKQEHSRTFPKMRDFRYWEHPDKQTALAHERHLHQLPQIDSRKRQKKNAMPLPAIPPVAGAALSLLAPYIIPHAIDKLSQVKPPSIRKRIRKAKRSISAARKEWQEPIIGE